MSTSYFNIHNNYKGLLVLRMRHSYYRDANPSDLSIVPTTETLETLRDHDLLYKAFNDGFAILYSTEKTGQLIDLMEEDFRLTFFINNTDPYLINYTELPFTGPDQFYSFNNLGDLPEKEGSLQLHRGDSPGEDTIRTVKPAAFTYQVNPKAQHTTIEVTDVLNNRLIKEDIKDMPYFPIDLTYEPQGEYTLKVNGKEDQTFYALHEKMKGPPFGMIDLFLKDALKLASGGKKEFERLEYLINFEARTTTWNYLFINEDETRNFNFSDYQITNSKKKISFTDPETITLPTGLEATIMASESPIALKEYPEENFQLKVKKNGKGITFQVDLPNPTVDALKINTDNGEMYSEIFVYL
ncbi:MAG: hypothetical protein AAF502_23450 [Bacteroidota bacterium]